MSRCQGNKSVLSKAVIQQALDAIKSGEIRSAYAAEKKFGVGHALLCQQLNGSEQFGARARKSRQLTILKEDVLVA